MKANLELAIELCRKIELICPMAQCHVALTGGCLYKDGDRKDIDLIFYRIRQADAIDYSLLFRILEQLDIKIHKSFKWVHKASYKGVGIDIFFPEADDAPGDDFREYGQ